MPDPRAWWWGCRWTARHRFFPIPELVSGRLRWRRCRDCNILAPEWEPDVNEDPDDRERNLTGVLIALVVLSCAVQIWWVLR